MRRPSPSALTWSSAPAPAPPHSHPGRQLLFHELAHTVQQQGSARPASPTLSISLPGQPSEPAAQAASSAALSTTQPVPCLAPTPTHIARQPAPAPAPAPSAGPMADPAAETKPEDPHKGEMVSQIVIDLTRERVGFVTSGSSMIRGSISTDLKPGSFKVAPDLQKQQWIFEAGVNSGLRFVLDLEGADPWTLTYPPKVNVLVGNTVAGGTGPINLLDLLKLQDEMAKIPDMPAPATDTDPDHFDAATYDLDYRSQGGALSTFLKVAYANGSVVDMSLDVITPATPRRFAAKGEALKIMGEYNLLFIMGAFGTVFFILNIDPFVAGIPNAPSRLRVNRRRMIKSGSKTGGKTEGKTDPTPEGKAPTETTPAATPGKAGVEDPAVPSAPGVEPKVTPVNGKVNVGGGLEKGSAEATNLNLINPNSGGPSRGIPDHVKAGFEDIADVIEPGSAKSIFSNRLRFGDVTDWPKAAAVPPR